tara:strand:- start:2153 stop:2881 length:729 start_codon:yes stop_codon:yes gene_type:complete
MIIKLKVFLRNIIRKISLHFLYEKISLNYIQKKKIGKYLIDKAFEDKAKYIPLKKDYFQECLEYMKKFQNSIFLEFGVGDGGSARIISEFFSEKQIYGFDSFEGFKDEPAKNSFWESYQKVFKESKTPELPKNYVLIKGYLEETFDAFIKKKKLHEVDTLLIHFDMDVYEPTKLILNFIRKSKKKTIIMFDEFYNYEEFEKHEWRAFYEEILCENIENKMLFYTDCSSKNFGHLSKFCFEIN